MNKIQKYSIGAALALFYYLAYSGNLSHIISYHEQHHLFLFTEAYFEQQVQSEGFFSYLTDFIIQFFYYPALGSALLALLIASVYLMASNIIRFLFGKEDLLHLSVIPSLALFYHTMEASHTLVPITISVLTLAIINLVLWIFRSHMPLIPLFKNLHIQKKGIRTGITAVALLFYAGYGYYHFVKSYNRSEGIMLKAEMHVKKKDWDKVLDYTKLYMNSGKTNHLISYFHHLALYHKGELIYRLFDYPPFLGVKSLYFPWNSDSRESEYGHIIYEHLGHINEAHHWEFEAMAVWGETAPHLLNLAQYNIVNHRPKVAQRFINKLKQSLFYREEALRLEKVLESGQVEGLRNAVSEVIDSPARFTNTKNIGPELEYICNHDPKNKMAFEYLMSYLLLSNNVTRFVSNLHRIQEFSYPTMPAAYEEALLIYRLKVGEEEFSKTGFTISQETENRFARYYQLTESKQTKVLQQEFGHSYWFYQNYISPYGNKAIDN